MDETNPYIFVYDQFDGQTLYSYNYILSLFSEDTREDIKSVETLVNNFIKFSNSIDLTEGNTSLGEKLLYYGLVYMIQGVLYKDETKKLLRIRMDNQKFEETKKICNYAFKVTRNSIQKSLNFTPGPCLMGSWCKGLGLWQYRLWSFQTGGTKLEKILPKNQHPQGKENY